MIFFSMPQPISVQILWCIFGKVLSSAGAMPVRLASPAQQQFCNIAASWANVLYPTRSWFCQRLTESEARKRLDQSGNNGRCYARCSLSNNWIRKQVQPFASDMKNTSSLVSLELKAGVRGRRMLKIICLIRPNYFHEPRAKRNWEHLNWPLNPQNCDSLHPSKIWSQIVSGLPYLCLQRSLCCGMHYECISLQDGQKSSHSAPDKAGRKRTF